MEISTPHKTDHDDDGAHMVPTTHHQEHQQQPVSDDVAIREGDSVEIFRLKAQLQGALRRNELLQSDNQQYRNMMQKLTDSVSDLRLQLVLSNSPAAAADGQPPSGGSECCDRVAAITTSNIRRHLSSQQKNIHHGSPQDTQSNSRLADNEAQYLRLVEEETGTRRRTILPATTSRTISDKDDHIVPVAVNGGWNPPGDQRNNNNGGDMPSHPSSTVTLVSGENTYDHHTTNTKKRSRQTASSHRSHPIHKYNREINDTTTTTTVQHRRTCGDEETAAVREPVTLPVSLFTSPNPPYPRVEGGSGRIHRQEGEGGEAEGEVLPRRPNRYTVRRLADGQRLPTLRSSLAHRHRLNGGLMPDNDQHLSMIPSPQQHLDHTNEQQNNSVYQYVMSSVALEQQQQQEVNSPPDGHKNNSSPTLPQGKGEGGGEEEEEEEEDMNSSTLAVMGLQDCPTGVEGTNWISSPTVGFGFEDVTLVSGGRGGAEAVGGGGGKEAKEGSATRSPSSSYADRGRNVSFTVPQPPHYQPQSSSCRIEQDDDDEEDHFLLSERLKRIRIEDL